ncbi:hypothetical protein V6Z11_D02G159000 [Gossypium hirsutum]
MAFQPYCPVDCDPGETLEGSHGLSERRRPPTMARGPVTASNQDDGISRTRFQASL